MRGVSTQAGGPIERSGTARTTSRLTFEGCAAQDQVADWWTLISNFRVKRVQGSQECDSLSRPELCVSSSKRTERGYVATAGSGICQHVIDEYDARLGSAASRFPRAERMQLLLTSMSRTITHR